MKLVTGAVAVAVGLFGAGQASADVVKVGLIVSFSGAFATWGTQFQQAIEAYQAVYGKDREGSRRQGARNPVHLSRRRQRRS